jgi:hypothetical protein
MSLMTERKDFLTYENGRNKLNHKLYTDILHECFGSEGVIIGHHLTFGGDDNPNEIPSADTFLFDHEIMFHVFGVNFMKVLTSLASVPAEERDRVLANFYYGRNRQPDV